MNGLDTLATFGKALLDEREKRATTADTSTSVERTSAFLSVVPTMRDLVLKHSPASLRPDQELKYHNSTAGRLIVTSELAQTFGDNIFSPSLGTGAQDRIARTTVIHGLEMDLTLEFHAKTVDPETMTHWPTIRWVVVLDKQSDGLFGVPSWQDVFDAPALNNSPGDMNFSVFRAHRNMLNSQRFVILHDKIITPSEMAMVYDIDPTSHSAFLPTLATVKFNTVMNVKSNYADSSDVSQDTRLFMLQYFAPVVNAAKVVGPPDNWNVHYHTFVTSRTSFTD